MSRPSARQLWHVLEPVHAVSYFSPEPLAALSDVGYRGFWMGYFAQRSAPLGAVPTEVVEATFYNFTSDRVRRALPAAWDFAPPSAALSARIEGSVRALQRIAAGSPDILDGIEVAADLAITAALSAPVTGLALYAANRSLSIPDEPLERLWHGCTLLREHRGDGHVAALLTAGIRGRESHVLHSLKAGMPPETYRVSRDFTPEEWHDCLASLEARGLVGPEGLTAAGTTLKARIESTTDEIAEIPYGVLSDSDLTRLHDGVRPLALAVAASGDLPMLTPIGLDLSGI